MVKGGLSAPAGWHVEVVAQSVLAYEGRHVGVEGAEGLGPGPFVLQSAIESTGNQLFMLHGDD